MIIKLVDLWKAYSGGSTSGRVECPVSTNYGDASHIYRGYGSITLEKVSHLIKGKKGTQGVALSSVPIYGPKYLTDASLLIQD